MNSNIVPDDVAKLAYRIAGFSHKPVEQVMRQAMRDLAERVLPVPPEEEAVEKLFRSINHDIMTPIYDWREPDDMLYDEDGLPKSDKPLYDRLMDIRKRCAALPVLDSRTPEEIIGYDENGLPPQ